MNLLAAPHWLEFLEDAFFRLTEAGFAVASSPSAVAKPPSTGQRKETTSDALVASCERQSGGITANEVHFHGSSTMHGAARAPSPISSSEPPKPAWWKSWWAAISGIAILLAGVVPTLDYFHIEPPWRTKPEAVQASPPTAPAPVSSPPDQPQSTSPDQSGSATGSAPPSVPPTTSMRPAKKKPSTVRAASIANNVGPVYNNNGIIAPGATGSITQQVQGYLPPPPRELTREQMTVLIAKLQMAPAGSVAQLNFAASNDNAEVQRLFSQVENAFKRANHWTVNSQAIGKSMGTADGSTLTAEGIGCTVSGTHGSIAVDAMADAGLPCTRKAADWGAITPSPGDVVISIGSRIVPLE